MRTGIENRRARFAALYNQSFDYVYSYVLSRTAGNRHMAEEIVQETYTAAWRSLGTFRYQSTCRTWLCSIAKNKLRESYRKAICRERWEMPGASAPEELPDGTDTEAAVIGQETGRTVMRILGEMNPLYGCVLIMRYMDAMRVKDIAKAFGRSPKAVDGILQRAKEEFRTVYRKLEGGDWNE